MEIYKILYLLVSIAIFSTYSCSKCEEDEMWREKIELDDGSHVMLYHSSECSKDKPFFQVNEKKIQFVQLKNDVFDYCFSEAEIKLLLEISTFNVHKLEKNFYPEDDSDLYYYRSFMNAVDTTFRPYRCFYSLTDDKFIPINNPFHP